MAHTSQDVGHTFPSGELQATPAACLMQCEASKELAHCLGFLRNWGSVEPGDCFYTLSYFFLPVLVEGHRECHLCTLEVLRCAEMVLFKAKHS